MGGQPSRHVTNGRQGTISRVQTPPGFNKDVRDLCRILLGITVVLLGIDWPVCACISSVASVVTIHQGTALSLKNLNWSLLCWPTFAVCLFTAFIQRSAGTIDEEKAYTLKFVVQMLGRGCELIWAAIMGLCLFNAWVSSNNQATV